MSSINQQSPEIRHESTTINDLNNDGLLSIFEKLNIHDLIRCRLVCKRFLLCSAEVHIPEIIITNKLENIKGHWFHTNRTFSYRDGIRISTFIKYRSTFRLEKCRRLHFQGDYSEYELLNLNNFTQLEELKIILETPYGIDLTLKSTNINLPNLKICDICEYDRFFGFDEKLVLTTPKLRTLKVYGFTSTSLAHPDTMNHLELDEYDNAFSKIVHSLKNVQYLKVNQNIPYDDDILLKLPRLKTLVCNENYFDDNRDSLQRLHHFLKQKRILRRPDFRIYYQSVELVDGNKIDEYDSVQSILAFQLNNFNTLCDNISYDDSDSLDYNELMKLVKGNLPDNFFKKYHNIPSVFVSAVAGVNQQHLVEFLKKFEYLKLLHLNNASLDQHFYDRLYEISSITELNVKHESSRIINYDFLFKLKLLKKFITNHDSKDFFGLLFALFKELKYFTEINFFCGNQLIDIKREPDANRYSFVRYELRRRGSMQCLKYQLHLKVQSDFEQLFSLVNGYKNDRIVQSQCKTYSIR